jgi:hypothetical protein
VISAKNQTRANAGIRIPIHSDTRILQNKRFQVPHEGPHTKAKREKRGAGRARWKAWRAVEGWLVSSLANLTRFPINPVPCPSTPPLTRVYAHPDHHPPFPGRRDESIDRRCFCFIPPAKSTASSATCATPIASVSRAHQIQISATVSGNLSICPSTTPTAASREQRFRTTLTTIRRSF